ncbi:MAG: response regulator transcription factor [Sedimentisphaerales bacterium]|nr:response regulator transcription factor [Sedimentisphaerales bacterium]
MKKGCVILADSHQNLLEGVRGLLETMFDTVVMVADKKSLFEAAGKLKPELAVVDLSLPISGEVNVAREVKSRYPKLKFIILSVHDEPAAVSEAMSAGASGFVLKRSIATDIFPAVGEILKGGTYISPSLEV